MSRRVLNGVGHRIRVLRAAPRGERFQEIHRQRAGTAGTGKRAASIGGGVFLVLVAIVTYPIPGPPSTLILLVGLTMVAGEWVPLARLLDRLELRLEGGARRVSRSWGSLSTPSRAAVALASAALLLAGVYGVYDLLLVPDGPGTATR